MSQFDTQKKRISMELRNMNSQQTQVCDQTDAALEETQFVKNTDSGVR